MPLSEERSSRVMNSQRLPSVQIAGEHGQRERRVENFWSEQFLQVGGFPLVQLAAK